MRTPEALETLVEYGIVEEVLRPLMSGKEAQVYLVRSGGELRVAKIYKDAQQRSFKQRSEYTEGRTTRNTRDRRAMAKHTAHGRKQDEAAWRTAEVDAIYRLSAAGVRVPVPYHFVDGVLIMELVRDHEGQPASRLGDLDWAPEVAQRIFDVLLASVVRMLVAGVVHGDLSEFNVLMAGDGPVIIDFPQAVDPATNASARRLLIRDVDNLLRFLGRYVRSFRPLPYAQEMWELYQQNLLTPDTVLRGRVSTSNRVTNTADVLSLIGDADREHRRRTNNSGGPPPRPGAPRGPRGPKVEVVVRGPTGSRGGPGDGSPQRPPAGPRRDDTQGRGQPGPPRPPGGPRPEGGPPRSESPDNRGPRPPRPAGHPSRPGEGPPRPGEAPARPAGDDAGPERRRRRRRPRGAAGDRPSSDS